MKPTHANQNDGRHDQALALLELLRRHRGHDLTMEAIQSVLHLGPSRIREQLERLRLAGHHIESDPIRGFKLGRPIDRLSSELIEYGLGTERIGRKCLVFECTDSTNDVAWQYANEGGHDGLAVFAERQRSGRGRLGRTWQSPERAGVLCSVLLSGDEPVAPALLSLLVGLAAAETVEVTCGIRGRIKWPNDLYLEQRKVAGTIVESRWQGSRTRHVLGVGINCSQRRDEFPPELQGKAASLRQIIGQPVDRLQIAQQLLRRLDALLADACQNGTETLHRAWRQRCDDIGRRLAVRCNNRDFTGYVVDVDPLQGLLLQLDVGTLASFDPAITTVLDL